MEDRYARHSLIKGWDQRRLQRGRVLIAGAGAVGNEVIKLLALIGVGRLLIVDFDMVEVSNLSRTVLFREQDIGRPKAEVAAERAVELNPEIVARSLMGDLEFDLGLGSITEVDLVIGCLDSVQARLALNRACRRVGVPWLNGGITAAAVEVSLYAGNQGPCFECTMSPSMWERRNRRYSCTGLLSGNIDEAAPTTAITASLAAGYLANEAIQFLQASSLNESAPTRSHDKKTGLAYGQKIYLTLNPYEMGTFLLPQHSECLAHELWEPIRTLKASSASTTTRQLLFAVARPNGRIELNFDLLTRMRCIRCGASETVMRPAERCVSGLARCEACDSESRSPEAVSTIDAESEFADMPLRLLGVPDHQILSISDASERIYVQLDGAYGW